MGSATRYVAQQQARSSNQARLEVRQRAMSNPQPRRLPATEQHDARGRLRASRRQRQLISRRREQPEEPPQFLWRSLSMPLLKIIVTFAVNRNRQIVIA